MLYGLVMKLGLESLLLEEWHFIGVEEWPTIEALQKRAAFEEEELEAYRYAESKTYLGTLQYDEYTQS